MPSKKPAVAKKSATSKPSAAKAAGTRAASAAPRSRATKPRTASGTAITPMSHHDIAARAHDLYVQSGFQGHREVEFWLEAERQLRKGIKL